MTVYLDHNATAPAREDVIAAVAAAMALTGNASSVHGAGRRVRALVEDARDQVAALVGADPAGVVFTAGGTEANNLALRGTGRRRVLVSAIEHASVLDAAPEAEALPVDRDGRIDLGALEAALVADPEPALVSVMLANNETGVIQPVARVAEIAHALGALIHTDAVQAAGRMPVGLSALGVDLLTVSAHKLGGPQGVGALIIAGDVPLTAQIRGGGQERRRRAGTENAAAIAGFGVAAVAAAADLALVPEIADLRNALEARVSTAAPAAVIHGRAAPRLCNTTCLGLAGHPAEELVIALDLAGVAVGAGAACSSGKVSESHVLRAMGASPDEARAAIRVSIGTSTTAADVDAFVAAWTSLCAPAARTAA